MLFLVWMYTLDGVAEREVESVEILDVEHRVLDCSLCLKLSAANSSDGSEAALV